MYIFLLSMIGYEQSVQGQAVIDTFAFPAVYSSSQLRFKNCVEVDSSNNVWVGFRQIGAGKFDGTAWTFYDASVIGSGNAICFAFGNNISWVGTDSGLAKFNGSTWTLFDSSNSGLSNNYVQSLFADGNNLWIGTHSGIFLFDGSSWTNYNTSNSALLSDTITSFAKSGNDTMWVGTNNGVAKFFSGIFTIYNSGNTVIKDNFIVRLYADVPGNIWIETSSQKTYVMHNNIIAIDWWAGDDCVFGGINANLLGLNNYGNIVLFTPAFQSMIREVNFGTLNDGTYPYSLNLSSHHLAAIDASSIIWYSGYSFNFGKLFRIDYHNYLQPGLTDCNGLNINQVHARIYNDGDMHWDHSGTAQYTVPKSSGVNSVFSSGVWIGGLDSTNNLHMAAMTYRQSGVDFWPGPLDTTNATIDSATVVRYDSIWKVDRYTIDEFITQFNLGNVTSFAYPVPEVILNWPASGSGNISRNLAPYIDYNHDGMYNPYDGDYPEIRGDQELFYIFNDVYNLHKETLGIPLGVEIHGSAYAYNCSGLADSLEAINYTTFYHYRIINRSDTAYHHVYIAMMCDVDLGNYIDDYVGCDTTLAAGFIYNGDNNDDGVAGYGLNPPMQNVLVLRGPLADAGDGIDNNLNGVIDEPNEYNTMNHFHYYDNDGSIYGNPNLANDYYYYMTSRYRDSSVHVTYGGNGHGGGNGATNIPSNFFFPGLPYDTSTGIWNEPNAGNQSNDRRMLVSSGPFSLPAHSEKEIDYAYVWTREQAYPNGINTSIAKNIHDVRLIKNWFDTDSFPCNNSSIGIQEHSLVPFSVSLYPNPANQKLFISIENAKSSSCKLALLDITGRIILKKDISSKTSLIDVSNISEGIYFVQVQMEKGCVVKKFIKQ